jgi:anti-sigma regulatory factor (Ser/Thr protein kinase)
MLQNHAVEPILPVPVTLPASASSAGVARHLLRQSLSSHLRQDMLDDVVFMASELVTNAVVHARTRCELAVYIPADGLLRVAVSDCEMTQPTVADVGVSDEQGRGLRLVNALAAQWGVEFTPALGKTVWFEVAV